MAKPVGFAYTTRKNGEIVITHHGRQAAILRGKRAKRFLTQINSRDEQEIMARVTGTYKRRNER